MKKLTLLAIMLFPMLCFGSDRWTVLSMFESGNNDRAIGSAGEISRYQILKAEWKSVTTSRNYTDNKLARTVSQELMKRRLAQFSARFHRQPTDFEFYVLWNAPSQLMERRVSKIVSERAQRYQNLCAAMTQPVRLYASLQ